MADELWQQRVNRALALLDSSQPDQARTICMFNKVLDTSNNDDYVSDYYTIQQTAGGLPDGVSFERLLGQVSTNIRTDLNTQRTFTDESGNVTVSPEPGDDDFREWMLGADHQIVKIFGLVNATVHQAAPGDFHIKLYNYILDSLKNSRSLYSCYGDIFVDER
ncbi:MAG TPA: hypothetical protein VFF06_33520 [Polyangia bacterium]|nr:hypothetical protein [Polyangia bacterium]